MYWSCHAVTRLKIWTNKSIQLLKNNFPNVSIPSIWKCDNPQIHGNAKFTSKTKMKIKNPSSGSLSRNVLTTVAILPISISLYTLRLFYFLTWFLKQQLTFSLAQQFVAVILFQPTKTFAVCFDICNVQVTLDSFIQTFSCCERTHAQMFLILNHKAVSY